jgi:hypothetical protein
MNLWRPAIGTAKDFSLAQLWIAGGYYSDNSVNTIEAGWQVISQRESLTYLIENVLPNSECSFHGYPLCPKLSAILTFLKRPE